MAYNFSLAPCYDRLTEDVDYESFANFYEKIFESYKIKAKSVLDLACGTGSLSYILAKRGFEVIGVDASPDMLAEAAAKSTDFGGGIMPLFVNQTMEELDLYGTVDAAICCLDGINYLPGLDAVTRVFRRVSIFLEPGGVFIFDVNTPHKLRGLDGQVFLDEKEDLFCVWRAEFDETERACFYGIDIFSRQGKLWRRDFEEHTEYAYRADELKEALKVVGFEDIRVYAELKLKPPADDEQRIFITARKKQ